MDRERNRTHEAIAYHREKRNERSSMMRSISDESAIAGLLLTLEDIRDNTYTTNSGNIYLTHKEVRSLTRICLAAIDNVDWDNDVRVQVEFLLKAMGASGIPHRDRSFCAERIIEVVTRWQGEQSWRASGEEIPI